MTKVEDIFFNLAYAKKMLHLNGLSELTFCFRMHMPWIKKASEEKSCYETYHANA